LAITVTSIVRVNGPSCNHYTITVDDEGVPRTITISEAEIIAWSGDNPAEIKKNLVASWLRYRKTFSRALVGVPIA
jgi:hypothetical protein